MKTNFRPFSAAALFAAFFLAHFAPLAQTAPSLPAQQAATLSPGAWKLVQAAVFEVIVKKPEEAPSIVYDKEIDWTLVPYVIRTDKYYSIGTAFAISPTELVTAFHVIDLGEESAVYSDYYIRGSQGEVYEVDQVVHASNEKDFLVFTVKGAKFDTHFQLQKEFEIGAQVFSIGNALGEGIVVRGGLVLGTVPEEEEGRWKLLKSSADGNPGNSGGPLVTPEGKVVGIVTALRDNILYSLPAAAMLETEKQNLHYRKKLSYVHLILANRLTNTFEADVKLPDSYKAVRAELTRRFKDAYTKIMEDLFAGAPAYLEGPNNMHLLNTVVNTTFPEINYVDKNDNQWKLSDLTIKNYSLPEDGSLVHASVSTFNFMKINRPKNASLTELNTNPKVLLDLILSGINMERAIGSSGKYRILSHGEPSSVSEYRDKVGRLWLKARWLVAYEDAYLITYILPLPNGPAVIMTTLSTAELLYEWDIDALCNHVEIAYRADFSEWTEFLSRPKWVPGFLSGFRFRWDETSKNVSLDFPELSVRAAPTVFDWTSASALFLSPAHYIQGEKIEYGIRKTVLQRDIRGRDYAVIYKNVKPDSRLGAKAAEAWEDIVQGKYPFDGAARISPRDNNGSTGILLPQPAPAPGILYSLYLAMENPGSEEALLARLGALRTGITLHK
jgi:hypothetical protein